ncbi:GNAT family protein [Oceanobacillus sojae]|uniref:N-acetyltransferase n=1 Tax=Oceanobacillus sojae TaxID=582851 RepID=A0A511ZKY2_9BACI|nr:GNAT family protein [Oceanobacillus sojae]GEN88107.1 N-acetyltransferase [Oceanobacillus sojae]
MEFSSMETERLRLIEINQEHKQKIFEIFSKEEVTRYYGIEPFQKIEQAEKMIDSFQKHIQENRAVRWGIVPKDTEELAGTIGLNNLQIWNKRAEIGFDMHPDFWRMGYTSEAVKKILEYSFQQLNLKRVGAITYPENKASNQLLDKLGFQKEGLLRSYINLPEYSQDTCIYSFLKEEWEQR